MRLALRVGRFLFRLRGGGTVGLGLFRLALRLRRGLDLRPGGRLGSRLFRAEFVRQRLRLGLGCLRFCVRGFLRLLFWLGLRLCIRGFLGLLFRLCSRSFLQLKLQLRLRLCGRCPGICFRLGFGLRFSCSFNFGFSFGFRLHFCLRLGLFLRLSLRHRRGSLLGEDAEHHALDLAELLLGLVEHLLCGRHIAALLGIILLERGAQLRRGGVAVGRPALRGARDDLCKIAPGLARQRQRLAVHAAAQRGGHILRLRRAVVRVKRQTAAHHARIQQQAERIHVGRGIERAAPENLGRHELQLLGRPVLRVRAGGRAETDRTVPGTADVVRADAAVVCPALRQDAADRLGQRGQLRARERLQPLTEAACGIECVFFHVIRTSLCPCLRVYIT